MRIAAASLIFLAVYSVSSVSSSQATDGSAHMESAQRLAQVAMLFQQEDGAPLACVPERAAFGAELKLSYLARPASFDGISPQSAYWPEVEELNYQYRLATCPIAKTMTQGLAGLFAREMTTADLDAAVAFYSSPEGRRFMAAMARACKEFSALSQVPSSQQEAADIAYRNGLRQLRARYKSDPK